MGGGGREGHKLKALGHIQSRAPCKETHLQQTFKVFVHIIQCKTFSCKKKRKKKKKKHSDELCLPKWNGRVSTFPIIRQ